MNQEHCKLALVFMIIGLTMVGFVTGPLLIILNTLCLRVHSGIRLHVDAILTHALNVYADGDNRLKLLGVQAN